MWKITEVIVKLAVLLFLCATDAHGKYRRKRYLPTAQLWRLLAEVDALQGQQDGDTLRWYPDSYDYGALADRDMDKRVFDSLGGYEVHGFNKRNGDSSSGTHHGAHRMKRFLDTLGGFQVHGWKKRSLGSLGGFQVHGWKRSSLDGWKGDDAKRSLSSLGNFQVHDWQKRSVEHNNNRLRRDAEQLGSESVGKTAAEKSEGSHVQKRSLSSLGGFQVHGWKRADDDNIAKRPLSSLGNFQVHGWKRDDDADKRSWGYGPMNIPGKRGLSSLGDFQLHGYKRGLSSLGDFHLHGAKRGLSSLGGFNVHGYKRGLSSLGGFNVHGYKRGLSSLGGFNVHGYKRGLSSLGGFNVHGYKRGLSSLGGFNVHGYKRDGDDDKRALSSLGDFQIHGYKRGLSSLGDFNLHGYNKRGLSTLGGFQVHGWKRDSGDADKTTFDDEEDSETSDFVETTESIPVGKEQSNEPKNNEIIKVVPLEVSGGGEMGDKVKSMQQ